MEAFDKLVKIADAPLGNNGKPYPVPVYVEIHYDGRKLSISGVEGPKRSGHCWGACGQIDMHSWGEYNAAPGVDLAKLREIWSRWHLNGMRAGCEHQRAEGWSSCPGHYHEKGPWLGDRDKTMPHGWRVDNGVYVKRKLYVTITNCAGQQEERPGKEFGTNTRCSLDRLSQPCPTCGYEYGSAWLFEPVPDDVLSWLRALPEADHGAYPWRFERRSRRTA